MKLIQINLMYLGKHFPGHWMQYKHPRAIFARGNIWFSSEYFFLLKEPSGTYLGSRDILNLVNFLHLAILQKT